MDEDVRNSLDRIEGNLAIILKTLNGNGQPGLLTKVALQEQRIKDIPSPTSLKFYASVGGGFVILLGLLGYAIVTALSK